MQTSDANAPRECEALPTRHCERSEAIHCHLVHGKMDCFAALAMTMGVTSAYDTFPNQSSKRVGMIRASSGGYMPNRHRP